jgi:3-deoxy-D-manno-octulosonic-acid transferase
LGLFFYNTFLLLYHFGIKVIAFKSPKAKNWLAGRLNYFQKLQNWKASLTQNDKIIWVHCASLGEFEQGRPLIESIKKNRPATKILLTFFSPSGYEVRKNYSKADAVFYLPLDGKKNAKQFIDIVKPSFVIWVKYEYWYYYLTMLQAKNIPLFLVSAKFRDSQSFFKWYGNLYRKILQTFTHIFIQNDETSLELLHSIGITNVTTVGDTRFDRVAEIIQTKNILPKEITNFCTNQKVIVAGSTWQEDEELLVHYANVHPSIKFIIAPHDVDTDRIAEVKNIFKSATTFTELQAGKNATQVLIIDNIGMLSLLYKIANITYVGGGFNSSGIHNILEAAAYGKPVIFGPIYEKFAEAVDLVNLGGAFSVDTSIALEAMLDKLFADTALMNEATAASETYVKDMQGATQKIMQYFYENRLLTKL